jgi:hypothetical protein
MDSILQGRFTLQSSEFLLKTGHFIQGRRIINLSTFNDRIDFPDVPYIFQRISGEPDQVGNISSIHRTLAGVLEINQTVTRLPFLRVINVSLPIAPANL